MANAQLPSPIMAAHAAPLQCDSIKIDSITLDLSDSSATAATVVAIPFASNGGTPIFATDDQAITVKYRNLMTAVSRVPEIGPFLAALAGAVPVLLAYRAQRSVVVAAAQAKVDTATALLVAAKQVVIDAATARTAAFAARARLRSDDPAYAAASQAWTDADAAWKTAQAAVPVAQAAADAANAVLRSAVDALDPSIPPVTVS